MSASEVIKEVRKLHGISRKRFAERLGLKSSTSIWMYEKKDRYPSRITWMHLLDMAKEVGYEVTTDMMKETNAQE